MTVHISARVAWHNDGWNGCVCKNPAANTYCVGAQSYPGQLISEKRSLEWENQVSGRHSKSLDRIPPCCFSYNTFGSEEAPAESEPPAWFNTTQIRRWMLPPSTVCIWPYEEMYGDDVRTQNRFDYEKRLENARTFFNSIQPDKSLVFYYANYSNPFSEEEAKRYVLVGISRIKSIGEELFYEGCSDSVREKYAGGFVWQRSITSHYPDQGFRIPYHVYKDKPEILERIALFPENPRLFKYGSRQFDDDAALGLVESFLRVVRELKDIGDTTENWTAREKWLEELISELWQHRGLLPGMPAVLELLSFHKAIDLFKQKATDGKEIEMRDTIFDFLECKLNRIEDLNLNDAEILSIRRQWKLKSPQEQNLLRDILPLFSLQKDQLSKILDENRSSNGIRATLDDIAKNPYILSEQYQGDDPDDFIPWGTIDRGMIPSPELGGKALAQIDDSCRFRALLVTTLQREEPHVFTPAEIAIAKVNQRLSVLPEWKRFVFNERFLAADEDLMSEAIEIRKEHEKTYLYLREVFEDERLLEQKLDFLMHGPDILLTTPITEGIWEGLLKDPNSILARKASTEYQAAIEKQIEACQRIFIRQLGVLAGEAGTGKTTVIRALIKAIKRGHGAGTSVIALAPTGKAADRIREVVEQDEGLKGKVEIATIHSFLAKRGWLNNNMTFKRSGGKVEEDYSTYILDECSMLDLSLTAAFFKAVKWNTVQRLILVGDPNQLPPIGRGRIFADIIESLKNKAPESVATLEQNLRQLTGRYTGGGTGIIDLAQCYIHHQTDGQKNEDVTTAAEQMLKRIQFGGEVAPDLRVIYWQDQEDLFRALFEQMTSDLKEDIKKRGEEPEETLKQLWRKANKNNSKPSYFQILSPYRGEFFGIDEINRMCQDRIREQRPSGTNTLGGVMLFDKVIQVRNRPKSNPIWAWNTNTQKPEAIEIYNGQIGFVWPHSFDQDKWKRPYFRLERFCVVFDRREDYRVSYGKELGKNAYDKMIHDENVEENLELAYAISIHKAQGSEFERVYVIIPKSKHALLSTELFYTAITRARVHCTLFVEQDITPLLGMRRLEASRLRRINSSLFNFKPVPEALLSIPGWYEDGRIHQTLADIVVRSKSEVIIANMLFERDISFSYEKPLFASDGTFYLPDFTINWRGKEYYWEHVGMLHNDNYRKHWEEKRAWYERFFKGQLIVTEESSDLSKKADEIIRTHFI